MTARWIQQARGSRVRAAGAKHGRGPIASGWSAPQAGASRHHRDVVVRDGREQPHQLLADLTHELSRGRGHERARPHARRRLQEIPGEREAERHRLTGAGMPRAPEVAVRGVSRERRELYVGERREAALGGAAGNGRGTREKGSRWPRAGRGGAPRGTAGRPAQTARSIALHGRFGEVEAPASRRRGPVPRRRSSTPIASRRASGCLTGRRSRAVAPRRRLARAR